MYTFVCGGDVSLNIEPNCCSDFTHCCCCLQHNSTGWTKKVLANKKMKVCCFFFFFTYYFFFLTWPQTRDSLATSHLPWEVTCQRATKSLLLCCSSNVLVHTVSSRNLLRQYTCPYIDRCSLIVSTSRGVV